MVIIIDEKPWSTGYIFTSVMSIVLLIASLLITNSSSWKVILILCFGLLMIVFIAFYINAINCFKKELTRNKGLTHDAEEYRKIFDQRAAQLVIDNLRPISISVNSEQSTGQQDATIKQEK